MLFLMYIYSGARIFKFVFLGGVRKKEITRISRCVWGVWLFQVFNLKTITVNPIVYGYRIIKREIFYLFSTLAVAVLPFTVAFTR